MKTTGLRGEMGLGAQHSKTLSGIYNNRDRNLVKMATQFYPQIVKEAIDTTVNSALYPKKTCIRGCWKSCSL